MLSLYVAPADLADPGRWRAGSTGQRWQHQRSRISPYLHPALETGMTIAPDRRVLVVNRERVRGRPTWCSGTARSHHVGSAEYARRREEAHTWPLGYVLVEAAPGHVQVIASPWGVAPVHLTAAGGALRGSWDLLDLAPHVDTHRLDPLAVIRFLTYATTYSSATLLADIVTVTERATATYTGGDHVTVAYPPPGLHALPRQLRPGADPVGVFGHVLAQVIEHYDIDPDEVTADVSGGMDSATVAQAVARLYPGRVATGAMLLKGPMGAQQARRRAELVATGYAGDTTVDMIKHLPFAPGGRRRSGTAHDPREGAYAEARDILLSAHANQGRRVLFTGLGGDEAMKLRAAERAELGVHGGCPLTQRDGAPAFLGAYGRWLMNRRFDGLAPLGPTLWSILDVYSAIYPQHMRHGIWPINPLAAPQVVRLAESLPATWRANKRLLRQGLAAAGFSREVVHPPGAENFQDILDTAMQRHGADVLTEMLDRDAILVEDGYVDDAELRRAAEQFRSSGQRTYDVYRPLMLESGLQSLQDR